MHQEIFTRYSPLLSFPAFSREDFAEPDFAPFTESTKDFVEPAGMEERDSKMSWLWQREAAGALASEGTGGAIRRRQPGWAMEERERASIDGEREGPGSPV